MSNLNEISTKHADRRWLIFDAFLKISLILLFLNHNSDRLLNTTDGHVLIIPVRARPSFQSWNYVIFVLENDDGENCNLSRSKKNRISFISTATLGIQNKHEHFLLFFTERTIGMKITSHALYFNILCSVEWREEYKLPCAKACERLGRKQKSSALIVYFYFLADIMHFHQQRERLKSVE